jgi:hypothetical protein
VIRPAALIAAALAVVALVALDEARGAGGVRRVGPCTVDPAEVAGVVDATVVSVEQPAFRCGAGVDRFDPGLVAMLAPPGDAATPSPALGCVLVEESPYCPQPAFDADAPPATLDVTVDGARRTLPFVAGMWQVCGLAPGPHAIELCSKRGPVACTAEVVAGARAAVRVEPVDGRVHARVDRTWIGTHAAGAELTVTLDADTPLDRYDLPPRVGLAWREPGDPPRARVCARAPATPGCTRCASADPDAGSLAVAAFVAAALARGKRRS